MLRRLARTALDAMDRWLLPLAARSELLASLYYLVRPSFRREHRAVLAGRLAYRHSLARPVGSSALLRRNVHRLEKGLVMVPRAASFAADYILETVREFRRAADGGALDTLELKWARDVLDAYFAVVTDTAAIAAARSEWRAAVDSTVEVPADEPRWRPRPRADGVRAGISYADFHALCQQRRSVRWFLPLPVPIEAVSQATAAAAQAPSACNRQPFVFRYFDDPARAAALASIPMGTAGYAGNVPALVVVVGDLSAYPLERDRHLIYIDAALASMQFMLALETLGLASCPINWPDIEHYERRMSDQLGLAPHQRPVMLIALGYPDPAGGVPFSAKKSVDSLLIPEPRAPRDPA